MRPTGADPAIISTDAMFEGFAEHEIETDQGAIVARVGGSRPPLPLLHGYPQTHLMWHAAAPRLAERFTVAGHDRGGRVAYRMALDHPERVSAAAVLDVVPTGKEGPRRRRHATDPVLLARAVERTRRAAAALWGRP